MVVNVRPNKKRWTFFPLAVYSDTICHLLLDAIVTSISKSWCSSGKSFVVGRCHVVWCFMFNAMKNILGSAPFPPAAYSPAYHEPTMFHKYIDMAYSYHTFSYPSIHLSSQPAIRLSVCPFFSLTFSLWRLCDSITEIWVFFAPARKKLLRYFENLFSFFLLILLGGKSLKEFNKEKYFISFGASVCLPVTDFL